MNSFGAIISKMWVTWTQVVRCLQSWSDSWRGSEGLRGRERVQLRDAGQRGDPHPDRKVQEGAGFHDATQNSTSFQTRLVYFWNFPFHVFGLWLTMSNKLRKAKPQIRGEPPLLPGSLFVIQDPTWSALSFHWKAIVGHWGTQRCAVWLRVVGA